MNQFAAKQKQTIHRHIKDDCLFRIRCPPITQLLGAGVESSGICFAATWFSLRGCRTVSFQTVIQHAPQGTFPVLCFREGNRPDKPSGLGGGRCRASRWVADAVPACRAIFAVRTGGSWVGSWETPTRAVQLFYARPRQLVPKNLAESEDFSLSGQGHGPRLLQTARLRALGSERVWSDPTIHSAVSATQTKKHPAVRA